MTLDEDGTPIYGQAESHKVSGDELTYTFTLREGLKWSDGEPLTADDFVYSWNRAISDETAADYAYMFESIEGYSEGKLNVIAPDERTVVVKLIAVTPYFLELCAFPTFYPVREEQAFALLVTNMCNSLLSLHMFLDISTITPNSYFHQAIFLQEVVWK